MSETQLVPFKQELDAQQPVILPAAPPQLLPLPRPIRETNQALALASEAAGLTAKITTGVLAIRGEKFPPGHFGGLASGFRRVAAHLEVLGSNRKPDLREFAEGELNWTEDQRSALAALLFWLETEAEHCSSEELGLISKVRDLFLPQEKPSNFIK